MDVNPLSLGLVAVIIIFILIIAYLVISKVFDSWRSTQKPDLAFCNEVITKQKKLLSYIQDARAVFLQTGELADVKLYQKAFGMFNKNIDTYHDNNCPDIDTPLLKVI